MQRWTSEKADKAKFVFWAFSEVQAAAELAYMASLMPRFMSHQFTG